MKSKVIFYCLMASVVAVLAGCGQSDEDITALDVVKQVTPSSRKAAFEDLLKKDLVRFKEAQSKDMERFKEVQAKDLLTYKEAVESDLGKGWISQEVADQRLSEMGARQAKQLSDVINRHEKQLADFISRQQKQLEEF